MRATSSASRLAASAASTDAARRRQVRRLEERRDRQLDVERAPQLARQLDRHQGVAAELEEVVVRPTGAMPRRSLQSAATRCSTSLEAGTIGRSPRCGAAGAPRRHRGHELARPTMPPAR
jgi:hypothetical protein